MTVVRKPPRASSRASSSWAAPPSASRGANKTNTCIARPMPRVSAMTATLTNITLAISPNSDSRCLRSAKGAGFEFASLNFRTTPRRKPLTRSRNRSPEKRQESGARWLPIP